MELLEHFTTPWEQEECFLLQQYEGAKPDADLKIRTGNKLESYAIINLILSKSELKQYGFGNTFTVDGLKEEEFDYMLSNPLLS